MKDYSKLRPGTKLFETLESLFYYRAMTAKQIYIVLNLKKYGPKSFYRLPAKIKNQKIPNIHTRYLKFLRDIGFVSSAYPSNTRLNKAPYYYLTRSGLEYMYEHYEKLPGDKGDGFHTVGYFSYDLHRPPLKQLSHHGLLTDLFLEIEHLKKIYPGLNIKYRDNRYASDRYSLKNAKNKSAALKRFMPDGELLLNGKRFWVEIDRGTEHSDQLKRKFMGYRDYLNYLKSHNLPVGEGILFFSETKRSVRWVSIANAFLEGIGDWFTHMNLMVCSLDDIEYILKREQEGHLYNFTSASMTKKLIPYTKMCDLKVRKVSFQTHDSSPQDISYFFMSSPLHPDRIFLFNRFDHLETLGMSRLIYFAQNFKQLNIKDFERVKQIIPVFYSFHKSTASIHETLFSRYDGQFFSFDDIVWFNIHDEPRWFTVDHNVIESENPLLTLLEPQEEKV